jgi:hypothetical protein
VCTPSLPPVSPRELPTPPCAKHGDELKLRKQRSVRIPDLRFILLLLLKDLFWVMTR